MISRMSTLPVSEKYLAAALQDGYTAENMTLTHRHVGDLVLPTGKLVGCDPFVCPEKEPFNLSLPSGTFPVVLSVAQIDDDQRVVYAIIRLSQAAPVAWEMLTVGDQDTSALVMGEIYGYPVDSGTGCFMDRATALLLAKKMRENADYYETLVDEMEKTYTSTWDWLDMRFGDGNLIAFSSGYGDGVYATYAGRDSEGKVSVIVSDFNIAPLG